MLEGLTFRQREQASESLFEGVLQLHTEEKTDTNEDHSFEVRQVQ